MSEYNKCQNGDLIRVGGVYNTSCTVNPVIPVLEMHRSSPFPILYDIAGNALKVEFILSELPRDADGYYIWNGGAQPVPDDWMVVLWSDVRACVASKVNWALCERFKVVSTGQDAEDVTLTELDSAAQEALWVDVDDASLSIKEGYHSLAKALQGALDQAQHGKGNDRHAQGQPFDDQPMQRISGLLGSRDGMAYQAIKKIQESQRFDDTDRTIKELYGAIVYLAGMIVYLEAEALARGE